MLQSIDQHVHQLVKATQKKIANQKTAILGLFFLFLFCPVLSAHAATSDTWKSTGSNILASRSQNWTNGVPQNNYAVIFDNTSTNGCTWDITNLTLVSLNLSSTYTNNVVLNSVLGVTGNVTISGGFLTLNQALTIQSIGPTGSITINNSAQYANSTSVSLNLSCAKTGGTCTQMQFSNDGATWSNPQAYATTATWTLATGDGTETVYAKFMDDTNNWSSAYSDTIFLDTVPPQCSVIINNGAAYTNSTSVALTLSATDPSPASGVAQMCVSNIASCSSWQPYATSMAWTLPTGDGTKTVYAWFKDNAGNVTSASVSDSITLDATAPTNGILSATAANSQVSLIWSGFSDATSGVGSYRVVFATGAAPSSCSAGTQIYSGAATSYTHTGLSNGTTYYYRVCAVDNAQNTSSGTTASATPAGGTPPTVTTGYATNIFATSAVLNGTVNPNGSSTTAYFQYGTTTSYGSTTTSQSMGSGTTAVSIPGGSISGLTCGTTYHYRAVGTYSGGTINGADSTFTPVSISVSITSPASGTTYTTAQTVTITASASASCGTISKVEFLDNGTVVATDTATPYAYSWTITAADNGTHSWIARAYDAIGQNTTSLPVSLTVNIGGGQTVWAEHVAGNSYDSGNAVAVDSSGNTVVVGYFQGTADFGGGSVTGGSGKTMFIAKYSVTGAYLWAKSFGSTGGVTANAVAVDSAGNIIVVGSLGPTGSTVNFGGGTLTSLAPTDIVIAKFSSAGTHLWSKIFNTGGYSSALGVAVDSSDNVVMTGSLQGGTNFGGGLMQSGGSTNTFIAKFSSVGTYLWSTIILSYLPNTGYGVAVDSSNNIVVTGSFQGTAYFGGIGGTTLTSVGLGDIYVTKLSPTGNFLWTKTFGTAWDENSYSVAIDSGSNIVITGTYTSAPLDFGGGPLPYNSGTDIFVAKFSLQGSLLWSKGFLASGKSTHVAVDGAGNVVLTGYFMSSVNLGGGLLTSAGNYDTFVAKYAAADGTYLWADRFGGAGNDIGYGVAVDGIGDAVATGFFAQTVNFGGISLTSTGPQDIFFIKLTP